MKFTVSFSDFVKLVKSLSRASTEEAFRHPVLFFETSSKIEIFQPLNETVYHTIYKANNPPLGEDGKPLTLNDVKMGVLAGGIELMEMPKSIDIVVRS